jgi:adenylate cyclase
MCEKAIALDPKYADAYHLLGFTYFMDLLNQWSKDPRVLDRVFQLAQQALALDPSNGGAYRLLSQLYLTKNQYDQAVAAGERAIVVDPGNSGSYDLLASALAYSGKPAEALKVEERVRRRDPRMDVLHLLIDGFAYNMLGRYEEAIPALKEFLSHAPDFPVAHYDLAVAYMELGREADARAEAAEILRISPQYTLADPKKSGVIGGVIKDVALAERWNADLRKAGLK